jgi:hypothetical protein
VLSYEESAPYLVVISGLLHSVWRLDRLALRIGAGQPTFLWALLHQRKSIGEMCFAGLAYMALVCLWERAMWNRARLLYHDKLVDAVLSVDQDVAITAAVSVS